MYHKAVILSLLIALLAVAGFAQSKVAGVVVDSAGRAVQGATVSLLDKNTNTTRTAVTDADGRFVIDVITNAFEVTITASGFATVTRSISASDADRTITLAPNPIEEQVTVTATRTQVLTSETAVPVSIVDRENIERQGVNTIGDIFRILPGTSTTNEGAFQVRPRIRGLDSNRVLVLVDGERLNNGRTSTGQSGIETGLVETSQIESVEVLRGSGSVLYGTDALAGTINIITRDTPARRESGFRIGAMANTFYASNENGRRGNLAVTGSNKFFAFRVSQSMERFDNYSAGNPPDAVAAQLRQLEDLQITDDGEVLNSQSHGSNSQATLRFFLNDTNSVKLSYERRRNGNIGSAGLAGANTGIPGMVGVFNAFFPFNDRDKFSARYDVATVTEHLQRVSAKAYYQTQHRNFTNILTVPPFVPFFPGLYQLSDTVTDTKTTGFDLQTDWLFGRHNVVAGASWFEDKNTDRRLLIQSTTSFSPNRTFRNSRSVPDASLSNVAVFAQDDFRITNRLRVIGGVRFDRFATKAEPTADFVLDPRFTVAQIQQLGLTGITTGLDTSYSSVTGDVGAVYSLIRSISLSARIGRSFRTPNISERFFTDPGSAEGFLVGNPLLEPETGINFDTSVRVSTSRVKASATYFNNYFRNFLATRFTGVQLPVPQPAPPAPPRPPVDVYQTQNVRTARIQGFEAELEAPIKISVGYLTPYGNFSYLRGEDIDRSVPLDGISPARANVGFRWLNFGKSYYFDYNARFVADQRSLSPEFREANDAEVEPGFVTHNLGGGYYFRQERFDFNVHIAVTNLLNKFYTEQFVFAPARGRSFTIGTTIQLK